MTKKEKIEWTKARIKVQQAFVDGHEILALNGAVWEAVPNPMWFPLVEYRIGDIEYKTEGILP